ncbi:MAG: GntR family transcriptional regulator [Streptosporangiales bacterium]
MAPADSLKPISREPTAGLIADQLREAIMSGALAQGDQLGEADLAARFGVSRGPLREAMQRLVQEGLLRSVRHRGLFVTELTPADIDDIYAARMAVEGAAVTMIVQQADPGAANRLGKAAARMERAAKKRDHAALSRSDLDFHEVLVAESGSARLERMARTLLVETRMCMAALPSKYHAPADLAAEHASIVEAIKEQDTDRALALLEDHMHDAIGRLAPHQA